MSFGGNAFQMGGMNWREGSDEFWRERGERGGRFFLGGIMAKDERR